MVMCHKLQVHTSDMAECLHTQLQQIGSLAKDISEMSGWKGVNRGIITSISRSMRSQALALATTPAETHHSTVNPSVTDMQQTLTYLVAFTSEALL